jgi:Zn-finger nucleic acid-binding protein
MEPTKVNEVALDLCSSCGGMWLDRDELRRLSAHPEELEALRKHFGADESEADPEASGDCPACDRRLSVASIGSFRVEYCTTCGGVFLDRGELDKVLEQTKAKNIATIVALANSMVAAGSVGE